MFIEIFIILVIVFIHELGHFLAAKYYGWRVLHINLWIFGGELVTEEHSERPLFEQVVVTLAGPFQHLLIYLFIIICSYFSFLPEHIMHIIFIYNTVILFFNFLPIWPLDGGKLLFIFLCLIFPYRLAYSTILIVAMCLCIVLFLSQLLFFSFSLSAIIIFLYFFFMHIIFIYNTVILFFNFLPIWPLDGGKLLFIFLCLIFPYRLAYSTILIVAMCLCIVLFLSQLLFFSFTLSAIIIFAYLLLRNITEWKQRFFVFMRFLLQRYHMKRDKKHREHLYVPAEAKIIDILSKFKISHNYMIHIIQDVDRRKVVSEESCLHYFFTKHNPESKLSHLIT